MQINKLIVGVVFFALVGCASAPDKDESDSGVLVVVDKKSESVERLTEISPDVMYLLMTAEIAGQRNRYDVALDGYLEAAKRVEDVRVAERAAKIGLFVKDTKKTTEAVSLWLKQDESNLTARKIAVLSALKGGDKQQAVTHLNKMLEDDPAGFEGSLLELTRLMGKERKAAFIFDVLEDVAVANPGQAVVFFVQAMLAGQLNKSDVALDKSEKSLKLQPEWDKALILHAQLSAQRRQYEQAREDLEKVLKQSPNNNKVRKILGQVLMKTNDLDLAVSVYKKILETDVDDGESQFAIALIYLQQKKQQDAKVYLKKLVNRPRWDAQASFYLGRVAFKEEMYDESLVWFDKVTKGVYEFDASMAAVSVLLVENNYAEVESRIAALLIKFPQKQIKIFLLKADFYTQQNKYQEAFDILSDGLNSHSGHRDLLYGRALVAEKIDRLDVLEADLKQVLQKNPNDIAVLNALGYTLVDRTDRFKEAEKYLQLAFKLSPENALIMDSMGWLRFKQGQVAASLELLRAAYDKQAENEIAAHLAEVLIIVGSQAEASEIIDKALEASPDDEYLLKFKMRFPDL